MRWSRSGSMRRNASHVLGAACSSSRAANAKRPAVMRIVRMPPVRYARLMAGTLSTHVLDTGTGRPASGVAVSLYKGEQVVASGTTDDDGRIRELARGLAPGAYRLVFEVTSPFFKRIALDVELGDGHHHVPLLVSPYGIASYRGS